MSLSRMMLTAVPTVALTALLGAGCGDGEGPIGRGSTAPSATAQDTSRSPASDQASNQEAP